MTAATLMTFTHTVYFHYFCLHFVLLTCLVQFCPILVLFVCLFVCLFFSLVSISVCFVVSNQSSWLFYLNVHDHHGKFKIHIIIYLFCSHSCTIQFLHITNSLKDPLVYKVSRCFNWYRRTATATAVTWQRGYPANYYPVPEG